MYYGYFLSFVSCPKFQVVAQQFKAWQNGASALAGQKHFCPQYFVAR